MSAVEKETARRRIRALLEEGPHGAKEISFSIRKAEKEVFLHPHPVELMLRNHV